MRKAIGIILSAMILISTCACGSKVPAWQEQYDLGVRYLNEGNYKEAIIAFEAAIETEPKNVELYLALVEAYIAIGDIDTARKILDQGYAETDDQCLLSVEFPASLGQKIADLFLTGYNGQTITPSDITFMGHSVLDMDIDSAEALMRSAGYEISTVGGDEYVSGNSSPSATFSPDTNGYDEAGTLIWYWEYTYDTENQRQSITSYRADGSVQNNIDFA